MTWFTSTQALLPDFIDQHARWRDRQAAVVCGEESLDWAGFGRLLRQTAAAYAGLGLEPGDRVAILASNSIEMLAAMLGATCGGFVAVPLNVSVTDESIGSMIANAKARAVVASDEHTGRIDAMRLPESVTGLVAIHGGRQGWLDFRAVTAEAADSPFPRIDASAECNIIFSSGTTGLPKGIVHTHACRVAWARELSIALRYYPGARSLVMLGLFSNISWAIVLNTLFVGGTLFIERGFDVARCLRLIEHDGITHMVLVPVLVERLLEAPALDAVDRSGIASIMCCGAPLSPGIKHAALDRLTPNFIELYGLTEGLITTQDPADMRRLPASVGKPIAGQAIRILRDDDSEADVDEPGEIVGLGPLMMAGYLNRDEANAEATWTDADGRRWLRTGDIGRVDAAGNLYIVDRKKDMIISGGQNIYPGDIESVLNQHEDVRESAVIGVASRRWGETPLAVVVVAGDADIDAIMTWTNSRVGRQQRISGIRSIAELPRNPAGKILKRTLKEQFANVSF